MTAEEIQIEKARLTEWQTYANSWREEWGKLGRKCWELQRQRSCKTRREQIALYEKKIQDCREAVDYWEDKISKSPFSLYERPTGPTGYGVFQGKEECDVQKAIRLSKEFKANCNSLFEELKNEFRANADRKYYRIRALNGYIQDRLRYLQDIAEIEDDFGINLKRLRK
ncbi:MAG: hypothetical protein IJS60_08915 [Abditibacteriota bacterium]|nr:hypothetical protein [Abditibacteriota bacterium]